VDSDIDPGYREIKGRRWRISDPSIPEPLRQQLVNELMSARRAVAAANRTSNAIALRTARRRVQSAKTALGERGPKWWRPMSDQEWTVRATATLFSLLNNRQANASLCPSEVARASDGRHWRKRMPDVRLLAEEMTHTARLCITCRGEPVSISTRGPIRLARGERFDDYFSGDNDA